MLYFLYPLILIFAFLHASDAQSLDGRNRKIVNKFQPEDPGLAKFALFKQNAPRPKNISPSNTSLPLKINRNARIVYVGNTLLDRSQDFGYLETLLHQAHPNHSLKVRNFAWSADAIDLQPRPANFADTDQHLVFAKADIIFVAFGFNESFKGMRGLKNFRTIFDYKRIP